jgi:hypothetical protein
LYLMQNGQYTKIKILIGSRYLFAICEFYLPGL